MRLAVGREEGAAVVALAVGDPARVLAVGVHDVDLGVAVAERREDDALAVGRVAPLGVVAGGVGQADEVLAVGVGAEDVHERVEVPAIALRAAIRGPLGGRGRGPGVVGQGGVEVRRREEDRLAVGVVEAARALALARADELRHGVGFEVGGVDLVVVLVGPRGGEDGGGRPPGGLEDDPLAVGPEVSLARPGEPGGDLADVRQVPGLARDVLGRPRGRVRRLGDDRQGQQEGHIEVAPSRWSTHVGAAGPSPAGGIGLV